MSPMTTFAALQLLGGKPFYVLNLYLYYINEKWYINIFLSYQYIDVINTVQKYFAIAYFKAFLNSFDTITLFGLLINLLASLIDDAKAQGIRPCNK